MHRIDSVTEERALQRILRSDAERIVRAAIEAVKPDAAVRRALDGITLSGRVFLVAVGKAGWQMANAAVRYLERPVEKGIVVTKYGHVMGPIPDVTCYEAGHPVPDGNGLSATQAVLDMTRDLLPDDTVLFLLSGGGSALFEKPLIDPGELQDITRQLLASGAEITEINTIRKRLSSVKGGRFAQWCEPAQVEAVILSDIVGDPLDMIASGPAAADPSTCVQAKIIADNYCLKLSPEAFACLEREMPKYISNVRTQIIGSVRELCAAAERECRMLGYETVFLTDQLGCEAREAGRFMASVLRFHASDGKRLAFLAGGETIVHVSGDGVGGRNQELALAAAEGLRGLDNAAIISVGSDGTDGPTDAAGGYADGHTFEALEKQGINPGEVLRNNDSYHALEAVGGLVITGPTGTNVNDIAVGLIRDTADSAGAQAD